MKEERMRSSEVEGTGGVGGEKGGYGGQGLCC